MKKLIVLAIVGFLAQLIDGALGMAYGISSTTLLLAFGIAPAVASATIHLSEVATTAASGIAHFKFGNVDKRMLYRLIIPGSIGAFAGACCLSHLPGEIVRPYISAFLLLLGFYVVFRFLFKFKNSETKEARTISVKQSIPLGLVAGFADATGGGGWGPIATPVLLSKKGMTARKVVGTVDTSEFAIAVSATLGFLISLGWGKINFLWVGALVMGGIIAAPIAAWLVRKVPAQLMGILVGGFIILINARTMLNFWVINESYTAPIYGTILLGWAIAVFAGVRKMKADKINKKERRALISNIGRN